MIKFINNYKTIDYTNIELSLSINDFVIKGEPIICVKCILDNLITIYYLHSNDMCNNNLDKFKELYFKRLSRFDVNDTPIFILNYSFIYHNFYKTNNDDFQYCVKFNTMNANTILFIRNDLKDEILYTKHKSNHILYVDSYVPSNIIMNNCKELKQLIYKIYDKNNK